MVVLDHFPISGRPNQQRTDCAQGSECCTDAECSPEPEPRADLSGKRVGDQPADMAEGELGGE